EPTLSSALMGWSRLERWHSPSRLQSCGGRWPSSRCRHLRLQLSRLRGPKQMAVTLLRGVLAWPSRVASWPSWATKAMPPRRPSTRPSSRASRPRGARPRRLWRPPRRVSRRFTKNEKRSSRISPISRRDFDRLSCQLSPVIKTVSPRCRRSVQ
ncbi:unnamed protein product, partial [Prorocentrum cordatum]